MGWPSWKEAKEGYQGQAKVERSVPRLVLLEEHGAWRVNRLWTPLLC